MLSSETSLDFPTGIKPRSSFSLCHQLLEVSYSDSNLPYNLTANKLCSQSEFTPGALEFEPALAVNLKPFNHLPSFILGWVNASNWVSSSGGVYNHQEPSPQHKVPKTAGEDFPCQGFPPISFNFSNIFPVPLISCSLKVLESLYKAPSSKMIVVVRAQIALDSQLASLELIKHAAWKPTQSTFQGKKNPFN
ncbi:hypothetical protein DSO57_1003378 [Entomophthora muscae]|uniref:Uncharacterized protein n=1 Tax=Entomophthora muscae TaxID=34485 RepID=A0ACC2SY18_9FUNG|nr:hypothetical protein DSO57_1003378 [Entomophthora muscae]